MEITLQKLNELGACQSGIKWYGEQKTTDLAELLTLAIKDGLFKNARWLLSHLMEKQQGVLWACECAESVIGIYAAQYPDDDRPAKAIAAARTWISNPTNSAAYVAAYDAADAAYEAADANLDAAYEAAEAACAAFAYASTYDACASCASYAADSAYDAYAAAYDADAAADLRNALIWVGHDILVGNSYKPVTSK